MRNILGIAIVGLCLVSCGSDGGTGSQSLQAATCTGAGADGALSFPPDTACESPQ